MSPQMNDTTRLDALEIRIVHQDEVIEDLNRTVIAQWKEIDRLSQQLARLTAHVANLAPPGGRDPGDEPPPPHW
jgi:SlyX protein